ncbi:SDP1L, partial [Symbiodinium microadriaticum]
DYLRFGWEGGHSASGAKLRFQYMFPQSLRWLGDLLFSCVMDNKSVLKLDTEHLKEVECLSYRVTFLMVSVAPQVVIANTGLHTFQEAFDRTGRIINITVAPTNLYDPPRLLNYLTAPHICVWSAAVASCAIPGEILHRGYLAVFLKCPGSDDDNSYSKAHHHYSDGSIENDLPMQQLSELFNVNHFIVSQVNPHSALFSTLSVEATVWSHPLYGLVVGILRFLKAQC